MRGLMSLSYTRPDIPDYRTMPFPANASENKKRHASIDVVPFGTYVLSLLTAIFTSTVWTRSFRNSF